MSTRTLPVVVGLFLLTLVAGVGAAAPLGPKATVKAASDEILAILSDPKVPRVERWARIAPVISENFDFQSMSRSILSQEWRRATPEQQKDFVNYFSQYIEGTYESKIEAYSGQRIEYTGEKMRGERAAVDSIIHTDSTRIPVSYYLRQGQDGVWKAYDVTIEGVSLVNSYRETYAAIARTSGISGILAHVRKRAQESRAGGAGAVTK